MKISANDVRCVVLASGLSKRFGGSKMLHKLKHRGIPSGSASPMLSQTIRIYSQVFERVYVVVSGADKEIEQLVKDNGANCIINHDAERGMSQSIKAGVGDYRPSVAWLIALGDMPYLSIKTVKAIAKRASKSTIVVPRTHKGKGNPVAIGTDFRSDLMQLRGDVGARSLFAEFPDSLSFYDCDDLSIHHDVDTPDDLI